MNAVAAEWVTDNPAWAGARPRLSVLIPSYRDDPVMLLAMLNREKVPAEVIVLDDGSGDAYLALRIAEALQAMSLPGRFVRLTSNEGRSKGRNRLVGHARAERLLFLDADMSPDSLAFLRDWLKVIDDQDPAVAFGGFSLDQTPQTREHALHRFM
ncbi:MAG: glycosyltransferase family 2 protein, partial [Pseudomonadota bacterium]